MIENALALARLGWAVIPIAPRDKRPLIRWKEYQFRRMTESELIELFNSAPEANLGVVTGAISNLLVVDADSPEVVQKFGIPLTPIAETARGRHYYFALPDARVRSTAHIADGLDVRAEGAYVLSPPSIHPSGKLYIWVIPPRGVDPLGADPAPPPQWLWELLSKRRARSAIELPRIVHGVPEGQRNISSAALIGKLLGCLPQDDWERIAWPLVRAWNALNSPPLPEQQLRYTFESIARKELQKRTQSLKAQNDLLEKFVNFVTSNFSQAQMAQHLKVSQSTVSRLLKSLKALYTSKRISFEANIANGCRFSSQKLCTKERG